MQDEVCGIGIVVLRETFETARERGDDRSDDDTEDDRRTLESSTTVDLWDSARYWMAKASDRFQRLSEENFCDIPHGLGRLTSPLAKEAGVPDNDGFSMERFTFWKGRYVELLGPQDLEDATFPTRWQDI